MFGKKEKFKKIPVLFHPFQIEKLKKIKGNLLLVRVGNENYLPTQEDINYTYEIVRKKISKKIKLLVVPYWIRMEILK